MRASLPTLDPLLHQPMRTQITAFLAGRGEATFTELKRALAASDGNLDAHLSKLLEADVLTARKASSTAGRARTIYALTGHGRAAFVAYVATLSSLLTATEAGVESVAEPRPPGVPDPA